EVGQQESLSSAPVFGSTCENSQPVPYLFLLQERFVREQLRKILLNQPLQQCEPGQMQVFIKDFPVSPCSLRAESPGNENKRLKRLRHRVQEFGMVFEILNDFLVCFLFEMDIHKRMFLKSG